MVRSTAGSLMGIIHYLDIEAAIGVCLLIIHINLDGEVIVESGRISIIHISSTLLSVVSQRVGSFVTRPSTSYSYSV